MNILIVDDEEELRNSLKTILLSNENYNFTISEAKNGKEAINNMESGGSTNGDGGSDGSVMSFERMAKTSPTTVPGEVNDFRRSLPRSCALRAAARCSGVEPYESAASAGRPR